MNRKIKLLALILVFNLLAFISPETMLGNKAFAADNTYDITEFFSLSNDNSINGVQNNYTQELNAGNIIENSSINGVEINYSYDTYEKNDTINGGTTHEIISENGITQWEVYIAEIDNNSDFPFRMALEPLARDYDFTINGENSSKVSILDEDDNAISNMNINYNETNNTYKIKGTEDYYAITSVEATLNENYIGEYSADAGELIINGNDAIEFGTGTIEIEVELVVDLSKIKVGDILHPGDYVSSSKSIQWDSRGIIVDGVIEDYPNVAGEEDESFEGWEVISVSDDLIEVEPCIEEAEPVIDLSKIKVGDILHPEDSVSGSKSIQWDSKSVIADGVIKDYADVAGEEDESFEGWEVVSVSDDLIEVEPVIQSAESQTISIVIKLRNK